jgi:predicted NBD/HSP70 family sugar kinase
MSLSGLSPFDRRGHQRRLIVDALRRARRASRSELATATGLSAQVVTLLVEDLLADGLVLELGRRQAARGQPPIDLALDPEGGFAIGLQVDRGSITGLVADLGTTIRSQHSIACVTDDPYAVLGEAKALVNRLVEHAQISRERIWGAGVVLPGPFGAAVDPADPLAMPAWASQGFVPAYAAALGMPVLVGNDATAAAIGEHLAGVARDLRSFVYLYLGEGIGGGIFADDRPFTGAFGNAGEIGRLPVADPDGTGLVPLESVASISALRALQAGAGFGAAAKADVETLLDIAPEVTERWYQRSGTALRTVIATIENLLDPEALVLGGSLPDSAMKRLSAALDPLPASVSRRDDRTHPRLLVAGSGRASPALGGATLPLFRALSPQPRAATIASRRSPALAAAHRQGLRS